jgi:RIO-like serine/threonine protein kinase
MKSFEAIHGLNVLHGDIRPENILVGTDGAVWIIDFEFSYIPIDSLEGRSLLAQESETVMQILTALRQGYE